MTGRRVTDPVPYVGLDPLYTEGQHGVLWKPDGEHPVTGLDTTLRVPLSKHKPSVHMEDRRPRHGPCINHVLLTNTLPG